MRLNKTSSAFSTRPSWWIASPSCLGQDCAVGSLFTQGGPRCARRCYVASEACRRGRCFSCREQRERRAEECGVEVSELIS